MPLAPDKKPESMGQTAYRQLREAIETGVLAPGDRISVNGLADQLSISRTPVREAIAWLETDGLIVHQPYLGRVVAQLDHQMVNELYAVRMMLEPAAAAMAARNATDAEIAVLKEMVVFEQSILDNAIERARHNRRFHEAVYRTAHNRYVISTLNALQTSMILLGPATANNPDRLKTAYAEHVDLVECIAARDANGAEKLIARHLAEGQRVHIKYLLGRQQPPT
ncbi:GntR family transcriptional regulator [Achromobacter aloeverae]|uniref:GntR family transcriptional regulator n=1 Tax=Achromobacter aloeverae TaxID=1750518 RepID=A0A4Q1HJ35_9BURK|nr:GntR family transcriptional regulator [Achromobacter aloeverae]RXN88071.1 GntR family transcriptional regulator [Achromobacter aloeverae]